MAGRMTAWSIELSQFDITFEAKKEMKAQTFVDFLAKFTPSTGETSFRLTFGTEIVIPVEVKELSRRTAYPLDHNANVEPTLEELKFIDE